MQIKAIISPQMVEKIKKNKKEELFIKLIETMVNEADEVIPEEN